MSASVYRVWSEDDDLLYVGLSTNPLHRVMQHATAKSWWREVTRITLEHFDTLEAASEAEVAAITSEGPRHNVRRSTRRISPERADWLRRQEEMAASHYSPPAGFACSNCTHRPQWVPKGVRLADVECPECNCSMIEPDRETAAA